MEKKETASEMLCKVANWLKKQDPEFTKNFKNVKSILAVWDKLPKDYDRSRGKITNYLNNNWNDDTKRIAMFINSEFGFRYFEDAPKLWRLTFGLSRGNRVWLKANNMWTHERRESQIYIDDLGNAKEAKAKLLDDFIKGRGEDYCVVEVSNSLKQAIKMKPRQAENLEICYSIPRL